MGDGPSKTSDNPEFFKVLLPGFNTKLLLPPPFVKDYVTQFGKAIIISPNGQPWNVTLRKDDEVIDGAAYFEEGWPEFVEAHQLHPGFLLVFRYEGGMVFDSTVYDLSGCQKFYPSSFSVPNVDSAGEKDRTSAKVDANDFSRIPRQPTLNCHAHSLLDKKRSAADIELLTIKGYMINGRPLYISVRFKATIGFLRECRKINFRDPTGRIWPIGIRDRDKIGKGGVYITRGWLQFARANQLKEGDQCIFQLETGKNKGMMRVEIQRCKRDHISDKITAKDSSLIPKPISCKKTTNGGSADIEL